MLFCEVYGCYYQVIAAILAACQKQALSGQEIEAIIRQEGFGESVISIMPKLLNGQWDLLTAQNGQYQAKVTVTARPLTTLEKRFLAALLLDKRLLLFLTAEEYQQLSLLIGEAEPLFRPEDILSFDQSLDGDPYDDEQYRYFFRQCLQAVKEQRILRLSLTASRKYILPQRLEYSTKDDKFRLHGLNYKHKRPAGMIIVNLARITALEMLEKIETPVYWPTWLDKEWASEPVTIEIFHERNALERCMLHFAKYEKITEYDEVTGRYLCRIYYAAKDETELLIQLLSFGPVIRVLGPESLLQQIRQRLRRQRAWDKLSRKG